MIHGTLATQVIFNTFAVLKCAFADDPTLAYRTAGPGVAMGWCTGEAFCTWLQGLEILIKISLCWMAFYLQQFSTNFAGKVGSRFEAICIAPTRGFADSIKRDPD